MNEGSSMGIEKLEDVNPTSLWHNGFGWMKEDINDGVLKGNLTPASNLWLQDEKEKAEFREGLVLEKAP